ncbi:purine nucleoside phosphorylase [Fusobacterium necrophorum subsp. funduliforme ATCC 51357]|uniref:purine-nucleoside phosphorylase n=1 Tax=Fusobacterium necrophorum TaxID=859 RepID=UPI00025E6958|nr:purine-nucleoside phosphorylase [Fusobacterium necrophorum]EIJ68722.1 purine nucleoside phosphorylase [Fusobacterium necrophorum subsp. funduliforme ATCC 51357]KAB0552996.1 purine-nucleoside phosphorylase [Fusobacterium necrophorum subsp. funduliforme]
MSVHIAAKLGEIAEVVLLPGDPLRAKWIAETFLEDPVCYTTVRGMYGYTGSYQGKKISIQGTGMGIPSISIYVNELIQEYGVKTLIRIGSAGSYQENVKIRDIVLAMSSSTDSALNANRFPNASFAPTADATLFLKAYELTKEKKLPVHAGSILTSDEFYNDNPEAWKKWANFGVLCVEMETAALYTLAAKFKVRALSILTISDSLVSKEEISSEERQNSFSMMVNLALGVAGNI